MLRVVTTATLLSVFALSHAWAQNAESTYAPEHCEFTITFPEEPYKTKKCEDENQNRCYEQISFTQVYDLDTTVNFRVICNEIDSDVKNSYSSDIMQATLRAMTKGTVVKTFDTTYREEEKYKQAGLVGEGKVGRTPTIYIAQLWIGDKSAFSVEAELIGDSNKQSDELFSTILRSASHKDDALKEADQKTVTAEEKSTEETNDASED